MNLTLTTITQRFPIAGRFTIARGSRTEAVVVVASVTDGDFTGRGECVPYARYGESIESVTALIEAQADALQNGATREEIQTLMPPGAARNALDCALWDFEAKRAGRRAWELVDMPEPPPVTTAFTISLGTPEEMAEATTAAAHRPLLKVKLGGTGDPERIAAVRKAAPNAMLIVDANEAWTRDTLDAHARACADAGVVLIEQPLPAKEDGPLAHFRSPVPLCADESVHATESLATLGQRYSAVNIKLDKTGGLTEALAMANAAKAMGFRIMAGCMVGTSLAMAPALLIGAQADFVDLDGPLLLAKDRMPGMIYDESTIKGYPAGLWG